MRAETESRRIWIAGHPIDVWHHPQVSFSWTPNAIQSYIDAEQWEFVFNALVLLADSGLKGSA